MTLIFTTGDFWIEVIELNITLEDAAGRFASALGNLQRPGHYMGSAISCTSMSDNDNSQAVGSVEVREQSAGAIAIGEEITGVFVRVNKQVGTAGSTVQVYKVMLFMRS